jgi:hypothetical protein
MKKTLAELFCARHGVPTENFEQAVLTRCLYPQARMFRNLLVLIDEDFFAPDLELIRATGQLNRSSGFAAEVAEYNYHAGNSGRLRREWKLRLSVTRLRALVLATLGEEESYADSMAPFALPSLANGAAQPVLSGSRK